MVVCIISINLDNMVPEIYFLSFFPGSVLYIENTDEISSPASHQAIKELEKDARGHPKLGK